MHEVFIAFELRKNLIEHSVFNTYAMLDEPAPLPAWLWRVLLLANVQLGFCYLYIYCSLGAHGLYW
jgi:hypothetical protein